MAKRQRWLDESTDAELLALFRAVAARDDLEVARQLDAAPGLATRPLEVGASRRDPDTYFLTAIRRHIYAGDSALHVAAAAHRRVLAESFVARGADVRGSNRRGAQPLHYAADGSPGADHWDPVAQGDVITYLVKAGADPDALDKSGVAPLHRAVRTRSADAVAALIESGADPRLRNKSGSTPLHLAVQNTGRSDSGSDAAHAGQRRIVTLLLAHGARPTDVDARGKTVAAAASSDWLRRLLEQR